MRIFGIALCLLFLLVMGYALQHFRAIEYGYKIETLRSQRDGLAGMNQALRLEEASLRDPERIDAMARKLGLQAPDPGQVIPMDAVARSDRPGYGERKASSGRIGALSSRLSSIAGLACHPERTGAHQARVWLDGWRSEGPMHFVGSAGGSSEPPKFSEN